MNVKKIWKKYYGYILSWFLTGLIFSFVVNFKFRPFIYRKTGPKCNSLCIYFRYT